ncbi:MAG: hypothetical protein R3E13_06880 [Alphaproteobacteria bacterium]
MRKILLLSTTVLLSACVTTSWNATNHYDEFTDTKTCRVEKGTQAQRDFARGFTGIYYTQLFYAENNNGQVRAGVRTDPPLPIGGDVQIKVGEKLYTLTSRDAPIDVAPTVPTENKAAEAAMGKAYAETMEAIVKNSQQIASPYRAYTGEKAKALLRDIASTSEEIKFRTVGVNMATSDTGSFTAGEDFKAALQTCGINL